MTGRKRIAAAGTSKRGKSKLRVQRQTLRNLTLPQDEKVKGGARACTQRSNDPTL
jgi:hypothetical protein